MYTFYYQFWYNWLLISMHWWGMHQKKGTFFFANKRHIVTNLELIYSSVTCVPETALHHIRRFNTDEAGYCWRTGEVKTFTGRALLSVRENHLACQQRIRLDDSRFAVTVIWINSASQSKLTWEGRRDWQQAGFYSFYLRLLIYIKKIHKLKSVSYKKSYENRWFLFSIVKICSPIAFRNNNRQEL